MATQRLREQIHFQPIGFELLPEKFTIKELQSLYQRFRVACLLDSGSNYLEVSDTTGASSATISRVNRCLNYGSGYRMALDNLKKAGVLDDDESDLEK